MEIMGRLAFAGVLIAYIYHPVLMFIEHMFFPSRYEFRLREYRMLASKLLLNDLMMIETINKEREQLGMPPIPEKPVMDHFKGIGPWASLRNRAVGLIGQAIRDMGGK